jgi:hypothetical protein
MHFPLTLSDISLWLAVTAIILLITSELLTNSTGYLRNLTIDRRRFRLTALGFGAAFLATVVLRIFQPF